MAIRDLTARIRITVDSSGAVTGFKQIDNEVKKTDDGLKRVGDTADKSTGRFKSFAIAAGVAMASIAAAVRLASKALEEFRGAVVRAGQERALEIQLDRSGIALESFVTKLDDAARGALSRADTISAATRAIALGVDTEAIPRLLEVARNSAIATGQTVTKAFEDIALGVARQSRLILDNLGIIVSIEEANKRYAEALDRTTESLTDTERRQAFLNEVLRKGEDSFSDISEAALGAGVAFDRLVANITDIKDSFTGAVAESNALTIAFDALSASLGDTDALEDLGISAENLDGIFLALSQAVPGLGTVLLGLQKTMSGLDDTTEDVTEKSEAYTKAVEVMNEIIKQNTDLIEAQKAAQDELAGAIEELGIETDKQIEKQIEMQRALIETALQLVVAGDITEGTYARAVAKATAEIEKLRAKIDSGYIPALRDQEAATDAAASSTDRLGDSIADAALRTRSAIGDTDDLSSSLGRLSLAQRDAEESSFNSRGSITTAVFDASGNIIRADVVRSDRNGGYTLRTGGTFQNTFITTNNIPGNFSSFRTSGLR